MNNKAIKFFLSSLIIGIPVFVTLQTKAHESYEPMSKEDIQSEERTESIYNNTDGGYDGQPIATVEPTEETVSVRLKNNTNAAIDDRAIGYTEH